MHKPNIVMIVSDHQLYRHHHVKRPCFETFQEQAFSFEQACCCTPLCGPARRTLLSGLYPHNHKNLYNQFPAPFTEETYLEILAENGYRNYVFGKWHAGPGTALDHASSGFSPEGYGNPYITAEYQSYLEKHHLPIPLHAIDMVFPNKNTAETFPSLVKGEPSYTCDKYWCGEPCVGKTVTPKETHEAFFLSSLASEKLEELAEHRDGPFHLRVDFWGPHQPYFPTQEYLDLYDETLIPEYPNFKDDLSGKPETYRHMNSPIADENGNLIIPSVFPWETWRHYLKSAYAQSTMVDDAAGRIIETIERTGLADDTIIIWTSDHGDALASHGGMFDKGSFMTEEIVRIPLAIKVPGRQGRSSAFVNTMDIAPTILDMAGTQFRQSVDGESLLPLINGTKELLRTDMMLESYGQGYRDTTKVKCLLTGSYKYCYTENDMDELYDLNKDPYELRNLTLVDSYQSLRKDCYERLLALTEEYGETDHRWMRYGNE